MTDWRLGTIGFGYDDWSGPFYPPSLKASDRLSLYARHFNAVELDSTFHAAPDANRVRRWADAVPADFRFCVKTPRAITHDLPLDRAVGPMRDFLDTLREFGPKLAAVLLQFPPSFHADAADRLEKFLSAMPTDIRLAIELRHRSWGTQRTLALLHATRCCLVSAEYLARPRRILVTTDFLYVRWIGQHGRFDHHASERVDVGESLNWWKGAIERALAESPEVQSIYGFFNNDYAGYAVGTADRFRKLMGFPVPRLEADEQGKLFG